MATALYNRYRPRTFGEVIGQGHVTEALARALETGRLHHAFLFSGPRGCGKTSSARILAASLNCVNGPTPMPCGECDSCAAIRLGASVDVVELDAASHGGVDDARELRERVGFSAVGRYRVFIVDEAHMITKEGFNALLKVVEEPPPHVVFIFATTDPDKVLPTIRSRTFHYQFGLVPPAELRAHLRSVCEGEGVTVEDSVLPLVVRVAEGSVRDALSVLDQLLAGAGPEGLTYPVAAMRLGLTDAVLLDEAIDALADRNGTSLFGVVERVVGVGHDPRRFAMDLLQRLRDLILLAAVPEARERGMLETVSDDAAIRMGGQADRLGLAELSRAGDVVHAALVEMRGTVSPRMALELLCARLLLPAGSASDVLVRLDRLERGAPAPASVAVAAPVPVAAAALVAAAASAETPARPPKTVPVVAVAGPGPDVGSAEVGDLAKVVAVWPDVLARISQTSKVAHVLLSQHGRPAALSGSVLHLAFTNPGHGRTFESRCDVVAEALGYVLGGRWRVVVDPGEPSEAPKVRTASPSPVQKPAPDASVAVPQAASRLVDRPAPDEPSDDDPVVAETGGVDGALALLQAQLGGTVIGEVGHP